ncbi:MAG TPA: hypothetical protein VMB72_13975 [Acidimicrobiales bacterium]|nr:hypothetical protein [Acidimicrobiales bacterium]
MNRAARRRASRPAGRTLARVGLVVSVPGATVLAATSGQGAALASGATAPHHHGDLVAAAHRSPSPLVAMRRIIEREMAAEATTTTTTTPAAPAPPAPTTTIAAPPVAAVAAPAPHAVVAPAPPPTTAPPRPAPRPAPPRPAPPRPAPPRPAPAPAATPAPTPTAGIVPPANPAASIPPSPQFETICLTQGALSAGCLAQTLQATDTARAREGLGPLALPGDYSALTAAEQLFVLADTERVDRGLPPAVGLVNEFDQDAAAAAAADTDPVASVVPPGVGLVRWASNWGENAGALGSNYSWMYDDGPGSGNEACGPGGGGGCWGHRDNILGFNAAQLAAAHGTLVMGAAEADPPAAKPWMSDTELFAVITGHPAAYIYTWAQAVASGAH